MFESRLFMFLGMLTIGTGFITIAIKWFSVIALREKQRRFMEVHGENEHARQRLKTAVGTLSITEGEIERLERKIRSSQRRTDELEKEYNSLYEKAEQQAALTRERIRLAEEMKKRKGPV